MGVDIDFARFLAEARCHGFDFGSVVTVGRLQLLPPDAALRDLATELDLPAPPEPGRGVADDFLSGTLGAAKVSAIDISDYEGAEIVLDLNEPIPPELEGRFDALVDGGSLEHVFNVPVALASYMRLVRPGGRLFLYVPANNHFGHGFYQFSSELFFRVFGPENGFAVERQLVLENHPFNASSGRPGRRYTARDPADVGERTLFVNKEPASLLVEARRDEVVAPFSRTPQQSDYSARWVEADAAAAPRLPKKSSRSPWRRLRRRIRRAGKARRRRLGNTDHFPPV